MDDPDDTDTDAVEGGAKFKLKNAENEYIKNNIKNILVDKPIELFV